MGCTCCWRLVTCSLLRAKSWACQCSRSAAAFSSACPASTCFCCSAPLSLSPATSFIPSATLLCNIPQHLYDLPFMTQHMTFVYQFHMVMIPILSVQLQHWLFKLACGELRAAQMMPSPRSAGLLTFTTGHMHDCASKHEAKMHAVRLLLQKSLQ